jgi:hypothetical protein
VDEREKKKKTNELSLVYRAQPTIFSYD